MASIKEQKLEGPWILLFKAHIAIVTPLLISWGIWVTNEQFNDRAFRLSGERFTQSDGRKLEDKIVDELYPKIDRVDQRMQQIERDTTQIFTMLRSIENEVKK